MNWKYEVPTALVVGSGPSAAGTVMALSQRPDLEIVVIDLGLRLEHERQRIVDELAAGSTTDWDLAKVKSRPPTAPVSTGVKGPPEKRAYGSNFPFRDVGQLREVTSGTNVNHALVSAAYGGFSTVWGSQVMPFTNATFSEWPISAIDMEPHYRAILDEVRFSGQDDHLAELFPLIATPTPLPHPSERTGAVLRNYARHREGLRRRGITLGRARLAFDVAEMRPVWIVPNRMPLFIDLLSLFHDRIAFAVKADLETSLATSWPCASARREGAHSFGRGRWPTGSCGALTPIAYIWRVARLVQRGWLSIRWVCSRRPSISMKRHSSRSHSLASSQPPTPSLNLNSR